MERIVKLVERETQKKELHTICLSFFGGEPLLKAKKIAIPLIRIISNICHKRDKRIQVNFTSNGVLLSKSVLESLKELKVNIHFQIPFMVEESITTRQNTYPMVKVLIILF